LAKISWTAEAVNWLKDIYDYIAQDNPEAATRTIEAIYDKTQILK
jgi:plasmid stabilization system protein ParE